MRVASNLNAASISPDMQGKLYEEGFLESMRLFDALPANLRKLLNEAPVLLAVKPISDMLALGMNAGFIEAFIRVALVGDFGVDCGPQRVRKPWTK